MMKRIIICILVLFAINSAGFALDLAINIETDKSVYYVGDEVKWSVSVTSNGNDHDGFRVIAFHLDDSQGEILNQAYTCSINSQEEFVDSDFTVEKHFEVYTPGVLYDSSPRLRDIGVFQVDDDMNYRVGQDAGTYHVAKGSYVITQLGIHTLTLSPYGDGGFQYWDNYTIRNFISISTNPVKVFNVLPPDMVELDGSGSLENPYIIDSLSDFYSFAVNDKYWPAGVFTKLACDIDLSSGSAFSTAVVAPSVSAGGIWSGIAYQGIFDGCGHTISNISIDTAGAANCYLGLFGKLGTGAEVKNLNVISCNISGSDDSDFLGGICGKNSGGTITNCQTSVALSSGLNSFGLGGICGENEFGVISKCNSTGSMDGDGYVGGLCGYNNNGTIADCYSTCTVIGEDTIGGLCGENYLGTIRNSYAAGEIDGYYYLGGLCGYNARGTIANSFSTAPVGILDGYYANGGLCGYNYYGTVAKSYSSGSVYQGSDYLGGLLAVSYKGDISDSFWDSQTSGLTFSDGGVELTTSEMQDSNSFLAANWDFNAETDNGTDDFWHMPYNATGYPMLYWQKDIPGDTAGKYGVDMYDAANLAESWLDGTGFADLETLAANWLAGK